ncbi:MAG: lamin tail domain-containing protein, partial [Bacteroidia bacterium]|nr:lamin tail domain-containing protein [Bacteroidia bacterium]MDW8334589.1 lamin tail domain-containing protein [Bacteroidia bacterium]
MSGLYRAFVLAGGCASPAASAEIFVSPPVQLNVQISGSTTVCSGDSLILTAQISGGQGNVVWTAPNGQTYFGSELEIANPQAGMWTLTVTPSCGPSSSQTFNVSVVEVSAPFVESNSPVQPGGTIQLTAIYEPPGTVYWTGPNGFSAQGPNIQIPNADAFDSGEYSAYVVAMGCTSAVSTVTVVVTAGDCDFNLSVLQIPSTPGQPGAVAIVVNGGATPPYVYSLDVGWGTISDTALQSPFVVLVPNAGDYTLEIDAGCNDTTLYGSINHLDPRGCRDLFISEYVEGSGNNKAVEIYNPTGQAVNLASYKLWGIFNQGGTNQRKSLQLQGTVEPHGVHVVARYFAWNDIVNLADQLDSFAVNFNGNDALALVKYNGPTDSLILDVFGVPGQNPTDGWAGPDGIVVTKDRTLRRKPFVQSGRTNGSAPFNPLVEWEAWPMNTYAGLGQHSSSCASAGGCTSPGTVLAVAEPACVGGDLRLRAVVPSGTEYVLWHGPGGFAAVVDSVVVLENVTTQNSGIYTVVAYGAGCASLPATVNVVVGQNVNVSVNGTAVSSQVCEGGTIALSATGTPGAVFSWTGPNGFSSSIAGPTIPNVAPNQSGDYIVTARPANGCGASAHDTVRITVFPRPSAPQPSSAEVFVASGETLILSADGPTDAVLLWSGPGGFSAQGSTVTRADISAQDAGTYSVVAVVQGCSSVVAT